MRRFEGIIATLTSEKLIAYHVLRIDSGRNKTERETLQSLATIANAARLFPEEVLMLAEEQEQIAWEFTTAFKRSSRGKQAIRDAKNSSLCRA